MAYNPKDFYFKKAKEKNFAARSVFKLEEIDKRFGIFKKGYKVIDLGCAPGSWSQYASKVIGRDGFVIGIDLQKCNLSFYNGILIQGDAFDENLIESTAKTYNIEKFDIVMSDMAPKTSGVRLNDQKRSYDLSVQALDVANKYLKKGGNFIVKFFQSEFFEEYLNQVKSNFQKIEILRPKSTRKNSFEIFIIGISKR
jgi:23S rRNA (uridine2552-2'-O)-methyltransferase